MIFIKQKVPLFTSKRALANARYYAYKFQSYAKAFCFCLIFFLEPILLLDIFAYFYANGPICTCLFFVKLIKKQ